jgi:hypothetical protein
MSTLDDAINGVINEEVTEPLTDSTNPIDVKTEQEPSPEQNEPVVEQKKHEEAVPYDRFKDVVEERNLLRELLGNKTPETVEPEEDPEELVWESEGEKRLYDMLVNLQAAVAEKDEIINSLQSYTSEQEDAQLLQTVETEFNATLSTLGEFKDEERAAIATEASTYATNPDMSVEEATLRAYHYLTGIGKITKSEAPNPLKQVTAQKERLVSTPTHQPSPKTSASIESVNSLDEALAYARRELGED